MKCDRYDSCHKDWLQPDAEKDFGFISYTSVDNDCDDLATHGIFGVDDLCDDQEGDSSSAGKRQVNLMFSLRRVLLKVRAA